MQVTVVSWKVSFFVRLAAFST